MTVGVIKRQLDDFADCSSFVSECSCLDIREGFTDIILNQRQAERKKKSSSLAQTLVTTYNIHPLVTFCENFAPYC